MWLKYLEHGRRITPHAPDVRRATSLFVQPAAQSDAAARMEAYRKSDADFYSDASLCFNVTLADMRRYYDDMIADMRCLEARGELHEFLENKNRLYSVDKDYSKYSCINNLGNEYDNINNLIDDYFALNIEKNLVSNLKTNLKAKINKELKKQTNTFNNQQKQIDKKEKAQMYMTKGNLLTANSYAVSAGQKSVTLTDYETNTPVEIQLDETLSVIDNAKRYFALYNKTKKAYYPCHRI